MTLQKVMEEHGTPMLKSIARVFGVKAQRIYTVAKTAEEGVYYNAKEYNWNAIEAFMLRRLDPDRGLYTLEDVIKKALVYDRSIRAVDRRTTRHAVKPRKGKTVVDGNTVPLRKYAHYNMETPDRASHPAGVPVIMVAGDNAVYTFVLQTDSHTVLRGIGEDGKFNSQAFRVITNTMLNALGVSLSRAKQEMEKRYRMQRVFNTQNGIPQPGVLGVDPRYIRTCAEMQAYLALNSHEWYTQGGALVNFEPDANGWYDMDGNYFEYIPEGVNGYK